MRARNLTAIVAVCVLGVAAARPAARLQDAGFRADWKDGEIRQQYDSASDRTEAFLAWSLACNSATPTITFSAAFKGKAPKVPPGSFVVRADLGVRYNPNVVRTRTLVFVVDEETRIDVSDTLRSPSNQTAAGSNVENGVATIDFTDVSRLITARTVSAEVFGLTCSVTKQQIDRLYAFLKVVVPGGNY